jgi:hypothetical protein
VLKVFRGPSEAPGVSVRPAPSVVAPFWRLLVPRPFTAEGAENTEKTSSDLPVAFAFGAVQKRRGCARFVNPAGYENAHADDVAIRGIGSYAGCCGKIYGGS